jgi:hypothetical protein
MQRSAIRPPLLMGASVDLLRHRGSNAPWPAFPVSHGVARSCWESRARADSIHPFRVECHTHGDLRARLGKGPDVHGGAPGVRAPTHAFPSLK